MNRLKNPPAFPGDIRSASGGAVIDVQAGMSLRDWFAGQALTKLVSRSDDAALVLVVAEKAYAYAEAMLYEREKA